MVFAFIGMDIKPPIGPKYKNWPKVATGIGTEQVRAPRLPLQGEERERVLKNY